MFAVILLVLLAIVFYGVRYFPKRRLAALTVDQQIEVLKQRGAKIPPGDEAYSIYGEFIHKTFVDAEEEPGELSENSSDSWQESLERDIHQTVIDYYGLDVELPKQ